MIARKLIAMVCLLGGLTLMISAGIGALFDEGRPVPTMAAVGEPVAQNAAHPVQTEPPQTQPPAEPPARVARATTKPPEATRPEASALPPPAVTSPPRPVCNHCTTTTYTRPAKTPRPQPPAAKPAAQPYQTITHRGKIYTLYRVGDES